MVIGGEWVVSGRYLRILCAVWMELRVVAYISSVWYQDHVLSATHKYDTSSDQDQIIQNENDSSDVGINRGAPTSRRNR